MKAWVEKGELIAKRGLSFVQLKGVLPSVADATSNACPLVGSQYSCIRPS